MPPRLGVVAEPGRAVATCADRLRALERRVAAPAACSLTWFGGADMPPGRPASEACLQALAGLMEVNGRDVGVPRRFGLDVASVAAGLVAAHGTLAADLARARGNPVTDVQTSVLQAALLLLSHYFVVATGLGDALPGAALPAPGPPFCSLDGRWFEIETLAAESWKAFWARLGVGGPEVGRGWTVFRWRYERAACSLPAGLHHATARRTLDELVDAAAAAGISLVPVRPRAAALVEPGLDASRPSIEPVDVAERRLAALAPPPARPEPAGLPLAGVRVVEATSRIQGPFAGMLLRMLGADVTRVQPPEGDYGRAAVTLHRGKRAVTLDLGTASGRAELLDLAGDADVFLHNWRPGKAQEWALDVGDLSRRRPGLVYAHLSGWGDGAHPGGAAGTDFLVQAYTGLGEGLSPEDEPPFPSRVILCDLFGALVAAEGILAALVRREREGGSWEVRSSLLAGAMALQEHVLRDSSGRPAWGPLDRPLATADGWLVVDGADGRLSQRWEDRAANEWEVRLLEAGVACAVACDDLAAVPADPRFAHLFEPVELADGAGLAPRSPWTFA